MRAGYLSAAVFETSAARLENEYDLKGKDFSLNLENHNISYCTDEIAFIKKSSEKDVTSLQDYKQYFSSKTTNKKANKFLLKDSLLQNEEVQERDFGSYTETMKKVDEFKDFIDEDNILKKVVSAKELEILEAILKKIQQKIAVGREKQFTHWKEDQLFNTLVRKIKNEVSKKTGALPKPSSTGFKKYASNRIMMEKNTNEILKNMQKEMKYEDVLVGNLGDKKGNLYCVTEVIFQDGETTNSNFQSIGGVKKVTQKEFSRKIKIISENIYSESLFEKVSELKNIDEIDQVTAIHKLVMLTKYFAVDGKSYQPSNGESSMLLLHRELNDDKDVYILDEPEKSLGNDYISDVIVPLINEKAKSGKKVFISTHDANIAVRTLPYNSVYREHAADGYKTYVGNPFSNNLVNIEDKNDTLNWKAISMKRLEGGEVAFGERGKIYGQI